MKEQTLDQFIEEFETRKGRESEEKLIYFLETAISDENFSETQSLRAYDAGIRLRNVTNILNNASADDIKSNVILRKCSEFLRSANVSAANLLFEHQNEPEKMTTESAIDTTPLLEKIEDKDLEETVPEMVEEYNSVAERLDRMYEEINRLKMWDYITQMKDKETNISTIALKREGNKCFLRAYFQKNIEPKFVYVK